MIAAPQWFHILAKKAGEKRAMMLCSKGRTRLRVHAFQYSADDVDRYLELQRRDNPDWTFTKRAIP
jgi:hypothetical protein